MKNKLDKVTYSLRAFSPVLLGLAAGVALTLIAINYAALVLDRAIVLATGIALAALMVFALVRLWIGVRRAQRAPEDKGDQAFPVILRAAINRLTTETEEAAKAAEEASELGRRAVNLGLAMWSATAALGIGIAALGTIIAMITALAALRQVDRIDAQNQLIEKQIEESFTSRVSANFNAQLPSLLRRLEEESASGSDWTPSASLRAQVWAMLWSLSPYPENRSIKRFDINLRHIPQL